MTDVRGRRPRRLVAAAVFLTAAFATVVAQGEPLSGARPAYTDRTPTPVPNAGAIDRRFWAPGLDDGYVPQGVTVIEGAVLVSAYRSVDPKVGGGPTRIYAIDPTTGAVLRHFDLPAGFAHAGGIAAAPHGRLYVADTRLLGRFDLARAFAAGDAPAVPEASWKLAGALRGSFASWRAGEVWIGSWNPDGEGRMFAIPETMLPARAELTEDAAARSFAIPSRAQGAAFDPAGSLWVSRSSSRIGELLRIDATTGTVLATHQAPIGIEDLGFDGEGRLWSVSEAGARRWLGWPTFYPLLFRIDPSRLE